MDRHFLGFDPGGKKAFGWCVLNVATDSDSAQLISGTCSNATEAIAAVSASSDRQPAAVGIDAPMYWSLEGDRRSDQIVRTIVVRLGGQSGMVSHVNSLRGACLAQGILVAVLARAKWPDSPITESHPKALLRRWQGASKFASGFNFQQSMNAMPP